MVKKPFIRYPLQCWVTVWRCT